MTESYAAAPPVAPATAPAASPKNLLVATLLCFFLGSLGIHRFYTGKIGTGILMIVTLGGAGVWTLVDFIMLLCGVFKDKAGLPLKWQTL
jgi:TM2 domain-containing membrane protein YozV